MTRHIPWWAPVWAEFCKLWDFRLPVYAYGGLVLFTGLIALRIFHYERLREHVPNLTALGAMFYMFWGGWGSLIIVPLFLIIFAVYSVTVESQYGMLRIACTQPLSRFHYLMAKMLAIMLHAAAIAAVFCFLLLGWSFVCIGFRGGPAQEWITFLACCGLLICYCMGWTAVAAAAASWRRSILGGLMTAFLVFMAFAWMMIGNRGFYPYHFLRYYMYPLGPAVPLSWRIGLPNLDEPLWKFVLVMVFTPAVLLIPSLIYFHRRDISE